MLDEFGTADSRALHEPLSERLAATGPRATLGWLLEVLATQRPALRASNIHLVAYMGCVESIDWLEETVHSPVLKSWGNAAALLGTPWGRINTWLAEAGPHRLMALDALVAYRAPAPNMAPLAQIAAPILPDAPSRDLLEATLNTLLHEGATARIRKTIEVILRHADDIVGRRERGVAVEDLPRLFLEPETFVGAHQILQQHDEVISGIRRSIAEMLDREKSN